MLDMNAPYDVAGCIRFAQAVAPYDIFWLEEPLHWYLQPADFQRLAAASPIPLAHGEREWHRYTVRDFIDSGAIRYIQFDSTRHAGFTESLRIAHYAEQKGVLIAPHSVGHLHGHLVSAFGDAAFAAESHGDPARHPLHHAIYRGGAEAVDGMVHLSEAPGFRPGDRLESGREVLGMKITDRRMMVCLPSRTVVRSLSQRRGG